MTFKVTAGLKLPNLGQKVLVCTISHELIGRCQSDCMDITLGRDVELIRFW